MLKACKVSDIASQATPQEEQEAGPMHSMTHLAELGVVWVESQAPLQDRPAALQMVANAALLHTLLELCPGYPSCDQVWAHLHALLECLPCSCVVLKQPQ